MEIRDYHSSIQEKRQKEKLNLQRNHIKKKLVAKHYQQIIERKIRKLSEDQHRFKPCRSTNSLISTIHQLMEKHYESDKNLWITFLEITKAFSAIRRDKALKSLEKCRSLKHINLIH